jgi:hypothetical protein
MTLHTQSLGDCAIEALDASIFVQAIGNKRRPIYGGGTSSLRLELACAWNTSLESTCLEHISNAARSCASLLCIKSMLPQLALQVLPVSDCHTATGARSSSPEHCHMSSVLASAGKGCVRHLCATAVAATSQS